jgi:hypothetical protein
MSTRTARARSRPAGDGAWFGMTLALALLGIVMLAGTVVADRRFRA